MFDNVGAQRSACIQRVNGEAIAERFCHNLPADHVASFKHQNFFAFFGEICRGDQSVMSRADDDGIVSFH